MSLLLSGLFLPSETRTLWPNTKQEMNVTNLDMYINSLQDNEGSLLVLEI